MWFLLFIKQLPAMAVSELKEVLPPPMRHAHRTESQALEHGGMASPLMNDPPRTAGGH
jgi:hypothetical protein